MNISSEAIRLMHEAILSGAVIPSVLYLNCPHLGLQNPVPFWS